MTENESENGIKKKYNLKDFYGNNSGFDEGDRLKFAQRILLFLFILVIFVFSASYLFVNSNCNNKELVSIINTILDITKTAVPSIVSLVLGFYFGRKDS